jgi:hypothetical protein
MLVVTPVSNHDAGLVEDFCAAINFFGPYSGHTLLVVAQPSDTLIAKRVYEELRGSFAESSFYIFDQNGPSGWPEGPNYYWSSTVRYLLNPQNHSPWFWMELDTTPIQKDWLDFLDEEYKKCGGKLLGNFCSSPFYGCSHLNGVAVYPANFGEEFKSWKSVHKHATPNFAVAFDVWCMGELTPVSKESGVLQNNFRTEMYRETSEGLKGVNRQKGAIHDPVFQTVTASSKVVHGCIDGSLSKIVTGRAAAKT